MIRAAVNLRGCGSRARAEKSRGKNNDFRYGAAKVFGTPVTSCPSSEGAAAIFNQPTMAPLADQRVSSECQFLFYVIYCRAIITLIGDNSKRGDGERVEKNVSLIY